MTYREDKLYRSAYLGSTVSGATRWCDKCRVVRPFKDGRMVPKKNNPLRGEWHCKKCLGESDA